MGNAFADIATGVFYENMDKIYHKIGEDGKVHESSYMAPSWRYDGFGTWREGANSYYEQMWTRNHHSITVLFPAWALEKRRIRRWNTARTA